jgi:hypothetical protein
MSLFRRSSRPAPASRTRRAVARALATAPTQESRHELVAQATRL